MMVPASTNREKGGTMVVLLMVLLMASIAIAGVMSMVSQQSRLTGRRANVISALQYVQGAAAIACSDLSVAVQSTNSGGISYNLMHGTYPYTSSTVSNVITFKRTIGAPFTNQTVSAQIILTNPATPKSATIITTATVGSVTQTSTLHCKIAWGYPGAIISISPGTANTSVAKTAGQDGNVVINGAKTGPIIVDGNQGKAVLANGRVNMDTNYISQGTTAYSSTNYGSANEIPDYTTQGTSNTLFDINRFIAVADKTPGGPSASGNNHFTNAFNFYKAVTNSSPTNPIEGVVVVDITSTDTWASKFTDSLVPKGINIKGTLLFNFIGSGWDPTTEKIIVSADMNVNAANLAGLVATNPATYPSGYPPVYANTNKNPVSIDISAKGYNNFTAEDDMPAIIYTIGVLDLHGNANISGVMYTPSYMEIENKSAGNLQYIKGALIMGHGIYYENVQAATSIISFDSRTLDSLSTVGTSVKQVSVTYWE
jgi:hypothetical protein